MAACQSDRTEPRPSSELIYLWGGELTGLHARSRADFVIPPYRLRDVGETVEPSTASASEKPKAIAQATAAVTELSLRPPALSKAGLDPSDATVTTAHKAQQRGREGTDAWCTRRHSPSRDSRSQVDPFASLGMPIAAPAGCNPSTRLDVKYGQQFRVHRRGTLSAGSSLTGPRGTFRTS